MRLCAELIQAYGSQRTTFRQLTENARPKMGSISFFVQLWHPIMS